MFVDQRGQLFALCCWSAADPIRCIQAQSPAWEGSLRPTLLIMCALGLALCTSACGGAFPGERSGAVETRAVSEPLQSAAGPNRAVEACGKAVREEAAKLGAQNVEVVSAGPEHRNEKGQFVGPIRARITYPRFWSVEVREATMTCIVDGDGKLIKAAA